MRKLMIVSAVALVVAAVPAAAQQPGLSGGTVVESEPGKGVIVSTVEVSAQVVAIDRKTRTVALKGPEGNVVDVVAGDEVRNFKQIRIGDMVVARYVRALSLELKKAKGGSRGITETDAAARAMPGDRPAGGVARQVTAIADVVAVDPKKMTITLKGPRGNVVDLHVRNPDHFKVVKKGDEVEVTYTEALALSVEQAR
jgi:hypothetical protein